MVLVVGTSYKQMIASPEVTWTNVYMLDVANAAAGLVTLEDMANTESAVMGETARVYKIHCRNKVGGTGVQKDVNLVGQQTVADPDTLLPQWNTVKVTFFDAAGRPEIKYLRLPLYIDMIDGQTLKASVRTTVLLDYAGVLKNNEFYVGPNGEAHTDATVATLVQMRQTDWHRRFRPGFKRGWVPA